MWWLIPKKSNLYFPDVRTESLLLNYLRENILFVQISAVILTAVLRVVAIIIKTIIFLHIFYMQNNFFSQFKLFFSFLSEIAFFCFNGLISLHNNI